MNRSPVYPCKVAGIYFGLEASRQSASLSAERRRSGVVVAGAVC
jgi:hypothetical protein